MSLKNAMLLFFGIEAQGCLNFDHFSYYGNVNKQNWEKFEAQELLRIVAVQVAVIFVNLSLGVKTRVA